MLFEGLVALLWVVLVYELAGSGIDLDADDDIVLAAPLGLLVPAWLGVQPFIWWKSRLLAG